MQNTYVWDYMHSAYCTLSGWIYFGPAFTCEERSALQGSFTDCGVYGFADQRENPEGGVDADLRFGFSFFFFGGSVLRCSVTLSFHQVQGKWSRLFLTSPCDIEYLSCIWFERGGEGGEIPEMQQYTPPPFPQRPWNSTPCNRSPKMWLSFSACGTWLINYTLASAFNSPCKNVSVPNFTSSSPRSADAVTV